jgi:hypothetical protein
MACAPRLYLHGCVVKKPTNRNLSIQSNWKPRREKHESGKNVDTLKHMDRKKHAVVLTFKG